jgi:hypothetical protein
MATIVFAALGQMIGGPVGSAAGALIGTQIDQRLFGGGGRQGPRLQELKVTTSSYGVPVARHYGRVRTGGSIIWSTDLRESREKKGGGKGAPSLTSYSYSVSCAVALSSRPIAGVGRIWADGNLLRGAGGDLKVGGSLRTYTGHGDQQVDPLIASACGPECPAYRGLAYCVFEDLQLSEFGNRIPTLTFEIMADEGEVSLADFIPELGHPLEVARPLDALAGFSYDGGPLAATLQTIGQIYPLACDAGGQSLTILAADQAPAEPPLLPQPVADGSGESFGTTSGERRHRQADVREVPEGLHYYDLSRDFQPGLQRADGRARPGRNRIIEFPGTLLADDARKLANRAAERASRSHERLSWRIAELDPALSPGQTVRVPGRKGQWLVEAWEWRETGIELELVRLPHGTDRQQVGDPGTGFSPVDLLPAPTILHAFELPWDGFGSPARRMVYAAASSTTSGWTGAALFADQGGTLMPLGGTGRERSIVGRLATGLPSSAGALIDRDTSCEVILSSPDFLLATATLAAMANGANRALVGEELLQFQKAEPLTGAGWRITGLLRGRGGTEGQALAEHAPGTAFVLLDDKPILIDETELATASQLAAAGLADPEPVIAPISMAGLTRKPVFPVHPRAITHADGSLLLSWTRRARGAWNWIDQVEVPLAEEVERYTVGLGDPAVPLAKWETTQAQLLLSPGTVAQIGSTHSGHALWVRQVGSHSASDALLLHVLP